MRRISTAITFAFLLCPSSVSAQQRAVQFRTIDFVAGTIELFNFGSTTEDMTSWRLCSHDDNQVRVYSGPPGLGGMLSPGTSRLIDVSGVNVASPFDNDAYSISLFDLSAGGFSGTANMIDHLQWSIGGVNNTNADFRTGQAVTAGLWTAATDWIVTEMDTERIELTDTTGGILHSPADYVSVPTLVCDFDGDGLCGIDDLNDMLAIGPINNGVGAVGNEQFDLNGDSTIDLADRDQWLNAAASENGLSSPYKIGDADLSGDVDGQDFIAWNQSKFAPTLRWDQGDFNGDGLNDGQDFILWNGNKFTSSDSVMVPEPSTAAFLLPALGLVALFQFWRAGAVRPLINQCRVPSCHAGHLPQ